jgi:endonuclease/exonuclease/phosphatase (EEP) superfamily protein YafD
VSRSARLVRRAVLAAGWLLAAAMSAAALIRTFRSDTQPVLIGTQAVAGWLLLPSYPLAVAAFWRKRRVLGVVAVTLSLLQAGWAVQTVSWGHVRAVPPGSVPIRIVTSNVLFDNPGISELSTDLAATGADAVVLQEITPEHFSALVHSALGKVYPHHLADPLAGFHGTAIFSKLPLTGRAIDVAGYPMLRADLVTASGTVRLIDVHTVAPLTGEMAVRWRDQLAKLADMHPAAGEYLVLAGDFNATMDHAPMQRLEESGFRDAFHDAGSGWGLTWPQWSGPVPPVMRLDHVFVSADIVVTAAGPEANQGSDHRRLRVDLALPRSS